MSFLTYEDPCQYHLLYYYFFWSECLHATFDIRQRLCAMAWLDQHACTQAYRLVVGQSPWARAWIAQPIGCPTRFVDDTKATLQ